MKIKQAVGQLVLWVLFFLPIQSLAQALTPQEILSQFPGSPVFSDNFAPTGGLTPNATNWCTRLPYGGGSTPPFPYNPLACTKRGALDFLNDELQRYREGGGEHIIVADSGDISNGILVLNAFRDATGGGQYRAGMIRSNVVFKPDSNTDYYVRARVKAPQESGTWSTFWLLPSNYEPEGRAAWPPELDILEIPNNQAADEPAQGDCATPGTGEGLIYMHGQRSTPAPLTVDCVDREDWIETGLLWTNENACFMLNEETDPRLTGAILASRTTAQLGLTNLSGSLVCQPYQWKKGKKANSAAIVLNLAVGGEFGGVPNPNNESNGGAQDGEVDYSFQIDYVEVYRKCRDGFANPAVDFETYTHADSSQQRRIVNCVSAPAVSLPEITAPVPGSTLDGSAITVQWADKGSDATDYMLTVSAGELTYFQKRLSAGLAKLF